MKKIFMTLFLIAGISGILSAQFLNFGIKGGLNYSKLNFDEVSDVVSGDTSYDLAQDERFQGFHIGAFMRVNVSDFYLQPELLFNTSGGKVLIESNPTGTKVIQEVRQIKYNKVDIPLLAGYKFGIARINAGPVFSAVLSSDSELEDIIPNLESVSKNATIGFQAGVGLDLFKKITLDGRYEGGLSKLGDKFTIGDTDYPFDSRDSKWIISLGFIF